MSFTTNNNTNSTIVNNNNKSNKNNSNGSSLWKSVAIALTLTTFAVMVGIVGYWYFEGLSILDSFLNASMILAGMGPVDKLTQSSAKLFAGFYALFSGLVFIALIAIVLSTTLHAVADSLDADLPDELLRRRNRRF